MLPVMDAHDPVLRETVARITAALPVSRIILFGSMAHGDPGEWSDYDLAVVWDTPLDPFLRALAVARTLRGLTIPADIVAVSGRELEQGEGLRYVVWTDILQRGRVLYDTSDDLA